MKRGLKPIFKQVEHRTMSYASFIDPMKRGLKHKNCQRLFIAAVEASFIDPMKRGLKPKALEAFGASRAGFIH
jgi:hypothetical protein